MPDPHDLRAGRTVFVCRSGLLGDTLVALPSLALIRQAYPNRKVIFIGEKPIAQKVVAAEEVLRGTGLVDGFAYYRTGGATIRGLWSLVQLAWLTLRLSPELVHILEVPTRFTRKPMFFRLLGRKLVPDKQNFFSSSRTPRRPTREIVAPMADQLFQITRELLGVTAAAPGDPYRMPLSGKLSHATNEWLVRHGAAGKTVVGFGIWSNMPAKRWPLERFRELITQLRCHHIPDLFPVIIGGKDEETHGQELVTGIGCGAVAAGSFTVFESAHLLEKCALYVGNDTGTMHLAAAVGTACVGIFSARDQPGKWHPYGQQHTIIRTAPQCAGCLLRVCSVEGMKCLTDISVAAVLEACVDLLTREA